ncbi:1,4-alpha-glucan branching protein [Blastococcus sp. TF02A-35]|uniref:maltokinase N-terminal cap-like domain-containing protein n=1 Tax=Blastococcus sp. TF02A-35 TaxID=2559612 RepID=UPI001073C269|nr:1,4-alpha-glucan branching protein [Blastococcus sp. TF02A_35]TFV53161.1 1,4-alpha-glucan branching protein [Blastococcus sp. TF02A_35]
MATIHRTTMAPTKLELLTGWLPGRPWYRGTGAPQLARAGGFRLDDPAGKVGLEFMVVHDADGTTYFTPLSYRGAALPGAEPGLLGTSEHGVLGTRWIYDAAYDPAAAAQLLAFLSGQAEAQHQSESDTPDPSVQRRWTLDAVTGVTPLRVTEDEAERTTVTLAADGGRQLALDLVRVLQPANDEQPGAGSVTAEWAGADGSPVRGTVVVVR